MPHDKEGLLTSKSNKPFKVGRMALDDVTTLEATGKAMQNPDQVAINIRNLLAKKDAEAS